MRGVHLKDLLLHDDSSVHVIRHVIVYIVGLYRIMFYTTMHQAENERVNAFDA